MPTYDFRCQQCSRLFEAALPFGSKRKPPCPACGARKTEKRITPPAVHFKGTGFFTTDSRKAHAKKETKPEEPKPAKKEPDAAVSQPKKESPAGTPKPVSNLTGPSA